MIRQHIFHWYDDALLLGSYEDISFYTEYIVDNGDLMDTGDTGVRDTDILHDDIDTADLCVVVVGAHDDNDYFMELGDIEELDLVEIGAPQSLALELRHHWLGVIIDHSEAIFQSLIKCYTGALTVELAWTGLFLAAFLAYFLLAIYI